MPKDTYGKKFNRIPAHTKTGCKAIKVKNTFVIT